MTGYPRLCPRWPGEHCAHACPTRCALELISAPYCSMLEVREGLYVAPSMTRQQVEQIEPALGLPLLGHSVNAP